MGASAAGQEGGRGFTILYQILLAMLIIAVIPLGGLWYISIYKAEQSWSANVYQSLVQNSHALAQQVDDWTTMNMRLLKQDAELPNMKTMEAESQNPILKSICDTYKYIYLAFTVAPGGDNIGRSDGKAPKFYGDRDYFKQVIGGKDIGQQVLMGKTSQKPALVLARSIMSNQQRSDGVLAIAMTLEQLSETVTKTKIGHTGFAMLVDDNNRLIAQGKGNVASQLQDMSANPVIAYGNRIDRDHFIFTEDGKKIVAYKQKTGLGWTLVVQQDYNEAFAAAAKARNNALMLLGITLIAVLAASYLVARRLSNPIRNLTTIAEEISRGNLGAEISETRRGDEIGALARAIERMGVSIQMAFDRLRKKK